jgi:quinoprotein glucose dehydrogenase
LVSQFVGPEQGLLSVAFHPNFTLPGSLGYEKMYIFYYRPYATFNATVLSEWIVDSATSVVSPSYVERPLMQLTRVFWNHNGATMLFGPTDNYLYLTTGTVCLVFIIIVFFLFIV